MSAPTFTLTEYGSPRRPPLLFIRGLPGTVGAPHGVERYLERRLLRGATRERHVFAVGRPSVVSAAVTMEALAEEYSALISERFGGHVTLMGISTGASVALELAAAHPERVDALVIVAGAATLSQLGRDVQRRYADLLVDQDRSAATELAFATLSLKRFHHVGRVLSRFGSLPTDSESLAALVRAEDTYNVLERVQQITAPTLILSGGRDLFYPVDIAKDTAGRMSNSRTIVYSRSSHAAISLHPRLGRDVASFLRSVGPRA